MCLKPYRFEIIGLLLVIAGVGCLFSDSEAERVDGKTGKLLDYFICIFCAFLAAFFFLINGVLVKVIPIFTLNFL